MIFILLLHINAAAQNPIFSHGPGDGSASRGLIQVVGANNNPIFAHGAGDGFASRGLVQVAGANNNSIFAHGAGDGFAVKSIQQTVGTNNNAVFVHGGGDGFAVNSYQQSSALLNNSIFVHGRADGFAMKGYNQASSLGVNNAIFKHGAGDGFTTYTFVQVQARVAAKATDAQVETERADDGPGVQVYPNPSAGEFTVQRVSDRGVATVSIYDAFGREMYSSSMTSNTKRISLSTSAKGVFYVHIAENESVTTIRLVIY